MPGYATLRQLYLTAVFLLPARADPPAEEAVVQGTVTNVSDQHLEGRPVALLADGDTLDTATSGSDGSFAFTYTYRAEGREDMRDLPYPNPSGGGLRWEFDAGQAGALQITVYDVQGRRVYTASDEAGESGLHELRMQGVPGADGLYIIRVAGSGFAAETSFTAIGGSGIATAGVDDLSEIAGAEAAPEEFVIAGEGGEQYEDLTEPVPFGRDVEETLELQDRYFTVNSSGRALDEDGRDADASVVKSYAGSSEEFDVTGSFDLDFYIPKRLLGEGSLEYEFSGFGLEDKSLERDVSESVDLGDVSLDYKPEVWTSSEKVEWFEGEVDASVESLQDLESIVLNVEGESYSKDVSGKGGSVSFSHSFEEDGDVPYTVTVVDEEGREYDVSGSVEVADRHRFEVRAE